MPNCLKCGTELAVNEEGVAPVLCDRCAGVAGSRARRGLSTGTMRDFPATLTLMAINIAIYAAMVFSGQTLADFGGPQLINWGGNYGPYTIGGEYWRLVTAAFVHANFFHMAMNMWCLFSLGRLSEKLFGTWQTICIYLITGVGGSVLSIAFQSNRLSVGASGAIFGIAGALIAGLKFGNLSISAGQRRATLGSVGFFTVISLYLGISSSSTDNMCHLGGFVTGLLIGLPVGAFIQNKVFQVATMVVTAGVLAAAGQELVKTHSAEAQKHAAAVAWGQKDYAKATWFLERYAATQPDDAVGFIMLGEAYAANNQRDKAISAFEQALKLNPSAEDAKEELQQLRGDGAPQK